MDQKLHLFIVASVSTLVVLYIWDYVAKNYVTSLPTV